MANSKYEYVRAFEREEVLLPNTWIVVRIDGRYVPHIHLSLIILHRLSHHSLSCLPVLSDEGARGFHKLSTHYQFAKPNDLRALNLMNAAAVKTVSIIPDIMFAYGVSDEYSFVFERDTKLFERRRDKLVSTVCSTFTAAYVQLWDSYFTRSTSSSQGPDDFGGDADHEETGGSLDLSMLPTFDARAILYPTIVNLRDYLSWRQVDCHINNLYNTTFWSLVQNPTLQGGKPLGQREAEGALKGTVAADKHEILFSRFGINYNNEPEMYRKGSIIYREYATPPPAQAGAEGSRKLKENGQGQGSGAGDGEAAMSKTQQAKQKKMKTKADIVIQHCDIIKDDFWDERPWLLGESGTRKE